MKQSVLTKTAIEINKLDLLMDTLLCFHFKDRDGDIHAAKGKRRQIRNRGKQTDRQTDGQVRMKGKRTDGPTESEVSRKTDGQT